MRVPIGASLSNAIRKKAFLPAPSRTMASVHDSVPHTIRTANDPRQTGLYSARVSQIDQVNRNIRLIRLSLPKDPPLRHLPGQWLDVHIPTLSQAGGFTITSSPSTCLPSSPAPYLELAIQSSANPPAQFFHQKAETIEDTPLSVRVGGRFVYPPPDLNYQECAAIDRAVFVAGGLGVNPVMSMLTTMHGLSWKGGKKVGGMVAQVRVLYSTRTEKGEETLFYGRLKEIADRWKGSEEVDFRFTLFETGREPEGPREGVRYEGEGPQGSVVRHESRRITHKDLLDAIGPEGDRANTVLYICGPPQMTDEFVDLLQKAPGMEERRVLCEKWW